MPRWLRKVGKLADQLVDELVPEDVQAQVLAAAQLDDLGGTISTLTTKGRECATLSRETMQICDDTAEQRRRVVAFGSEIVETLQQGFTSGDAGSDDAAPRDAASVLETIQQLTAGDRVKAAAELAAGLDQAARQCVDKSVQMTDLMEEGMDSLPPYLQSALEGSGGGDDEDDGDENHEETGILKGLDRDLEDVQTCLEAIRNLNLSTALTVGVQAFAQITDKAQRSQTLFDSIRGFANDVQEIAQAFEDMNPAKVAAKSKDMLRCIRLSDEMRRIAQGAGKLIKMMIQLFEATADRISVLWSALAFAKDCMLDCVTHVKEAKQLCLEAKDKSVVLVTKSLSVKDQLQQLGHINLQSVQAVRSLSQDGEIQEAIDLATHMDDLVVECSGKVVAMVDRVREGFENLPPILTEGVDVAAAGSGRAEGDPEPATVEPDIAELEESRAALESADLITAGRAGVRGFSGVSDKANVCKELLELVEQFAGNCNGTIESFLSVWDLESAGKKITEMCQLVNLGEIMKQFADQIKRLLMAIIALMKAAVEKFKGLDVGDIGETLGSMKHNIENKVDDLKDDLKDKLQFWK